MSASLLAIVTETFYSFPGVSRQIPTDKRDKIYLIISNGTQFQQTKTRKYLAKPS
jgi:hypothetical protein